MPMEFSLKLMAVIGPNFFDAEWEFINDMIYEVDCIRLSMFLVDL